MVWPLSHVISEFLESGKILKINFLRTLDIFQNCRVWSLPPIIFGWVVAPQHGWMVIYKNTFTTQLCSGLLCWSDLLSDFRNLIPWTRKLDFSLRSLAGLTRKVKKAKKVFEYEVSVRCSESNYDYIWQELERKF